ncbi:MAG: undecaprenyl/decaprenyl-phosphate alpha-N-acetylglucosaminyl 1-phosphate transferase, partial [Isosphaeraceae bacterium]|nr:undecaprenyl/decaprenyl-phosphate alpha-N-acetylglucosaminyl 1-phosphate transferase [Isosphaeraceae bacterium]
MLLAVGAGLVALAFVLSWGLCGLSRRLALRFGLVDRPGGRKAHKAPTPLGGGVAIWLATGIVLAIGAVVVGLGPAWLPPAVARHVSGLRTRGGELAGIFALATLIMLMGLADDRYGLGWRPRLIVQFGLATVFVVLWGGFTLFLPAAFRPVTGLLTILWIVGLTNAFNFLDNMDGLAASVGLIAATLFAAAQLAVESLFVPAVLLVLIGALGGFLVHNRPPARLFMGDAGSNFLGFLLGTLTVAGTFTRVKPGYSPFGVLTPLLVMAVPLYDSTSVILIRLREGRSPFQPDRRHFSHRLVARGLTPARAVGTIDLVTLAGGLGALLLHRVDAIGAIVVLAQTACLIGLVAVLEVSTPAGRPERERGDGEAKREG